MNRVIRAALTLFLPGILLVSIVGCNLPAPASGEPAAAPQPSATPVPLPSPTSLPVLTDAVLRSATYRLPLLNREVVLVDGAWQGGEGSQRLTANMLPLIGRGDLDGDGLEDAAVLIGENGGGSGTFVSLYAVLNRDGTVDPAANVLIDDRPRINGVRVENGRIVLDAVIHDADDPMVSPTLSVVQTYSLVEGGLEMVRLDSAVEGGPMRSIRINAPADGDVLGAGSRLQGEMPVAPFENNLRLRYYDLRGQVIFEGAFMVQAAEPGGPETFDQMLDLAPIPAGSRVRIELADISMKDGSVLAFDSLVVRRGGD